MIWIGEHRWSNNNKTSHIFLYIGNWWTHGLKLQFSGNALAFQLHFAEETEQYILYALRATWSNVDNISKNLKSVTMPIIPNAKAFYVSPSHINVYFFFYKCSGSQALSRILLAGRNWCSCLLQMLVNILYWSWGSGSWAGWLCMMSYSLHWWPRGRTRAPWNKSVQTAFMCSRGGAEKQGPPNGGIAARQPRVLSKRWVLCTAAD